METVVVTLLPTIIGVNIINIIKTNKQTNEKGRDTTLFWRKILNVCGLFSPCIHICEKEGKQHQNSTSASSLEATLSALLRAASFMMFSTPSAHIWINKFLHSHDKSIELLPDYTILH